MRGLQELLDFRVDAPRGLFAVLSRSAGRHLKEERLPGRLEGRQPQEGQDEVTNGKFLLGRWHVFLRFIPRDGPGEVVMA